LKEKNDTTSDSNDWLKLHNKAIPRKFIFPISHPHVDFLPVLSSIIAVKLIFYSLFACDCTACTEILAMDNEPPARMYFLVQLNGKQGIYLEWPNTAL